MKTPFPIFESTVREAGHRPRKPRSPRRAGPWALAAALLAGACAESDSARAESLASESKDPEAESPSLAGPAFSDPVPGTASGGSPRLAALAWGRLVDVYDRGEDGVETLRYVDLIVAPNLSGPDFELSASAGRERLVVAHPAESAAFTRALSLARDLPAVADAGEPIAVDAALSVRFEDALAPELASRLVAESTVLGPLGQVGARIALDPNHGAYVDPDGDGSAEFRSTRLIVDPAVSFLDRQRSNVGLQPTSGWRSASEAEDSFQLDLGGLRRAFRVSGSALASAAGPRVVSRQPVDVQAVQALGGGRFALDFDYTVGACAMTPRPGDLIRFAASTVEVARTDGPLGSGSSGAGFTRVPVRLLAGPAAGVVPGAALSVAPFEPGEDLPVCFVTFTPAPGAPPAQGVSAAADVTVYFDRRIDPTSVEALRTATLSRGWAAPALEQLVPASALIQSSSITLSPSVPLATVAPVSPAAYVFDLVGGPAGVLGLGGGELQDDLPPVRFELDPNQAPVQSSGVVLALDEVDEDGNGSPELRGQFVRDLAGERILARPVTRFSAPVDTSNVTVGTMVPVASGVTTPLNPLGAKLMSAWRYDDMGFGLLDENYHNIDVEGLYWSPSGNQLASDAFAELQMSLGHSSRVPDEGVGVSLLPQFPLSGLDVTYDQNWLEAGGGTVVHERLAGYRIDSLDLTQTATGTPIAPWPLNRGVPQSEFSYWTWRDTGVTELGGPNGAGVDTRRLTQVSPSGTTKAGLYARDEVPTIGLPLLTEIRTWPDAAAGGNNALRVALAINSSANPYFRTFSSGGVGAGGTTVLVDPDQEPSGSGGFNSAGSSTAPRDNSFYLGQADFVVRVSRLHSVWFDTGASQASLVAVVEPPLAQQPPGTVVQLAFRGADAISSSVPGIWGTTTWIDPYGDSYDAAQINKLVGTGAPDESFAVSYLGGDPSWKDDLADLAGARFLQVRATLISNPESGAVPTVSGLGLAYAQ